MVNTEMMSNQEVKAESVKIMRRMGVLQDLIQDYEANDNIPHFIYGRSLKLSNKEVSLDFYHVKHRPYAITIDVIQGMKMINFLFVSPYREDLDFMLREIGFKDAFAVYAYCYNLGNPEFSESGSILVQIIDGCIKRIG